MKHLIQFKSLLVLAAFCLMPTGGYSQVVTAPLDPTAPIRMSSAAGWRGKSMIGVTYRESNGDRELDSADIYKLDTAASSANLAFQFSNMALEGYVRTVNTDVTLEQYHPGKINLKREDSRLSVAMSGNDFVSVGLGGQTLKSEDYIDATNDLETTRQTGVNGSVSMKFMDAFFIGGGFERVKQESSFSVENVWNTVTGGIAMMLGSPMGTRFRAEYSMSNSPKAESDAQGELLAAVHNKTTVTRMAAEMQLKGLVFAAGGHETKVSLDTPVVFNGEEFEEIKSTITEAGVLWVPPAGMTLGFYFATETTSFFYEDNKTEFRVNLAYIFE